MEMKTNKGNGYNNVIFLAFSSTNPFTWFLETNSVKAKDKVLSRDNYILLSLIRTV